MQEDVCAQKRKGHGYMICKKDGEPSNTIKNTRRDRACPRLNSDSFASK